MKTKKSKLNYAGAAFVVFLLIINTTLLSTGQLYEENKDIKSSENKTDVFVDPNIFITKTKLPLLQKAVNYIEDEKIKQLVQEIIDVINIKGSVSSTNLRTILIQLNLENVKIHTGFLNHYFEAESSSDSLGKVYTIPGRLLFANGIGFYIGPAIFGYWRAYDSKAQTIINFLNRNYGRHSGYIIGFCGVAKIDEYGSLGFFGPSYSIGGLCGLIIINDES